MERVLRDGSLYLFLLLGTKVKKFFPLEGTITLNREEMLFTCDLFSLDLGGFQDNTLRFCKREQGEMLTHLFCHSLPWLSFKKNIYFLLAL